MTSRMHGRRVGVLLATSAAMFLLFPSVVAAHAELESTAPADGTTVVGTPDVLSATFNEALTAESTLSIRNAAGDRLAVGGLDPADPARLLISPVPELAPGAYEMRWTAFSDDGHLERGTWMFDVEAAPATPTPAPSTPSSPEPSTAATPTASPSSTPTPVSTTDGSPTPIEPGTDTSGSGGGDVLLPIIAALAIVAVGAVLLVGRRGRPGAAG